MHRTANATTRHHHRVAGDLHLQVQITVEDGREYRTALDAEVRTLRGWRVAYEIELRCGCNDRDIEHAGLDRDEMIDALAERVGALDEGEPLTDYEMPVWRMDDDSIDDFARLCGE